MASQLSQKLGMIAQSDVKRVRNLLEAFHLPVDAGNMLKKAFAAMKKDKKREGETLHMVLLKTIGEAIVHQLTFSQLEDLVYDLC